MTAFEIISIFIGILTLCIYFGSFIDYVSFLYHHLLYSKD